MEEQCNFEGLSTIDPGDWNIDPGDRNIDPGDWNIDPGDWNIDPGDLMLHHWPCWWEQMGDYNCLWFVINIKDMNSWLANTDCKMFIFSSTTDPDEKHDRD